MQPDRVRGLASKQGSQICLSRRHCGQPSRHSGRRATLLPLCLQWTIVPWGGDLGLASCHTPRSPRATLVALPVPPSTEGPDHGTHTYTQSAQPAGAESPVAGGHALKSPSGSSCKSAAVSPRWDLPPLGPGFSKQPGLPAVPSVTMQHMAGSQNGRDAFPPGQVTQLASPGPSLSVCRLAVGDPDDVGRAEPERGGARTPKWPSGICTSSGLC